MSEKQNNKTPKSFLERLIYFCITQKLIVGILLAFAISWGLLVAPFDWKIGDLPRNPVGVDAIPDIGENQQIVFTPWAGRSPQDVEDQITYPLTVSLLGVPQVKTVRSFSMFGFSSIYIIFNEKADFYWSRTRILEKLNSLPASTLPEGVKPTLGPDATALGQVYWYTLEGRDKDGNTTGGWDLDEIRSVQDWQVKYSLLAADGVAEIGSIGGHVKEYQIDLNPNALKHYGIKIEDVFKAVKMSNRDVGAKTIEINRAEYIIRGIGFIKSLDDIKKIVLREMNNVPLTIDQVANVSYGPALRRGVLDKQGAEAVGGVVVARFGENPLKVIQNLKEKIKEISPGLPKKTLEDGRVSQLTIVPFYDRSGLIYETLGTLNKALSEEILITVIVVLLLLMNLRSSLLVSSMLPLAVLMCFIAMKVFGVDANVVALSGIAIAIGTIVDMGIVVTENILKHLEKSSKNDNSAMVIFEATKEVGPAILTAIATTIISFLPVFTMIGAEGKLFKPLAFTKTFALIASVIIALVILPACAHLFFGSRSGSGITTFYKRYRSWKESLLGNLPIQLRENGLRWLNMGLIVIVGAYLTTHWLPLGPEKGFVLNFLFVGFLVSFVLGALILFQKRYSTILRWALVNKKKFLAIPLTLTVLGFTVWLGFDRVFGFIPSLVRTNPPVSWVRDTFPGLGKEFMPSLDEGAFLYMPTTMTHASIGEAIDVLQKQDMSIGMIPEVSSVVGKLGRVDSALDPAPISMIETIIQYKPEFITDADGNQVRQWRDHIKSTDDIWKEIQKAAQVPGTTSAPKLQPIEARIVMLQTGIRAPMAIKLKGPDLTTLESFGLELEKLIKEVPVVEASAVFADRIVGKPYLEIHIDRNAIARYGMHIDTVQNAIMLAVGGKTVTHTVEGRERYPVRLRYFREDRDSIESLSRILVHNKKGVAIPLAQLAKIEYVRGPQVIKSEDTFLMSYVLFDKKPDVSEMTAVKAVQDYLKYKIDSGELTVPNGLSYTFTGNYENLIRSEQKLKIVLPLALFLIFLILYFQFRSVITTLLVFSGIVVAWAGGFILIWCYNQPWFANISLLGINFRELFQVSTINLSVAIWVGFLALFGIASDNGVIVASYLDDVFKKNKPRSKDDIHKNVLEAGQKRVRPCVMTTATTLLALLPVLTSAGRGSDIMVPMAIPTFGGMFLSLLTIITVPVLYAIVQEKKLENSE